MSRRGPPLEIPPYALHVRRADALMGMGKAEAALEEARRAIELEPERAEAWFEAARALLRLGRLEEAEETVRSGLGHNAQSSWGHLLHSAIASQQGDEELALEAAQRAVQLAPGHAAPYRRRGWVFLGLGRPRDAQMEARRAVKRDPEDPDGQLLLARVCLVLGEREEALAAAREAVALAPEEAWPVTTLGDVLDASEQPSEALQAYVTAIRNDPELDYAKARLVEVVEYGPLASAAGFRSVRRLFNLIGLLLCLRLLAGGATPDDLLCLLGIFFGIALPSLLIQQAGRLKLEDEVDGAWPIYREAVKDRDRSLPLVRRWLRWIDPR